MYYKISASVALAVLGFNSITSAHPLQSDPASVWSDSALRTVYDYQQPVPQETWNTIQKEVHARVSMKTLPRASAGGWLKLRVNSVNTADAGPFQCKIDQMADGKNWQGWLKVTSPRNMFSLHKCKSKQGPFIVQLPTDMDCQGRLGGLDNVCIVHCERYTKNGPVGTCIPFQQWRAPKPCPSLLRLLGLRGPDTNNRLDKRDNGPISDKVSEAPPPVPEAALEKAGFTEEQIQNVDDLPKRKRDNGPISDKVSEEPVPVPEAALEKAGFTEEQIQNVDDLPKIKRDNGPISDKVSEEPVPVPEAALEKAGFTEEQIQNVDDLPKVKRDNGPISDKVSEEPVPVPEAALEKAGFTEEQIQNVDDLPKH